jgi:hypothetical protein
MKRLLIVATLSTAMFGCIGGTDTDDEMAEGSLLASSAQPLSDGTYQVPFGTWPSSSQIVSEWLSNNIPSYPNNIGVNQWWFCGHAAVSTAINHLRQKAPTTSEQITQLQWFHDMLGVYQGSSYTNDPHRQASIDALKSIMVSEKGAEFTTSKVVAWDREVAKNELAAALNGGNYVVALGLTDNGVGHFFTVYKIKMQAADPTGQGGMVYFSDVLPDAFGSMGFKTFLDRMRDAGTPNQWSFLKIKKK